MAASTLHHSQCALGAFLRRLKFRIGAPKAITATAHKLALIIYSMLKNGTEYVEAGLEYYEKQYNERLINGMRKRAAQLGFSLVPLQEGS
jgi:DNA/RNA-binding domain of Phe-tRNA-synthetase-like protein